MPGVFGRHAFALKNVPEVATASRTKNLDAAHPQGRVFLASDGSRYFIVEGRPAAAAVEFVRRPVQQCITAAANEVALPLVVPVFTRKGPLSAFVFDNLLLFGREFVPVLLRLHGAFGLPIQASMDQL